MPNITADKHLAPRQWCKSSSVSRLRSSSRFIFPRAGGDIKLQQRQKQHSLTPDFQQGFHLLCQLSAENVCLSDQSFQLSPCLSSQLPPHFLSKVRNEPLHQNQKAGVFSANWTTEILLMHLTSFIFTYCFLTSDQPLMTVSSFLSVIALSQAF